MDLSHRWLVEADIPAIRELLLANRPLFSEEECATAVEMIEETLAGTAEPDDPYQFLVTEADGKVVAYACFGTIPLTKGTFDLYWIAAHPDAHGSGVGRQLLHRCEEEMARQGGRLVIVETSSRKDYEKTRRFYEKTCRYETAAWIKDFYKPGDDKVVYVKYLRRPGPDRVETPTVPKSRTTGRPLPVLPKREADAPPDAAHGLVPEHPLAVENVETATFKCVFPVCGGICCKNGRPPVEPDEQARIDKNLSKMLPHLRPSARAHIEKNGWLTNRVKDGFHTIAVEGGWCVFENGGCTFQKVGMLEGQPWAYKPSACIRFPLEKTKGGTWYVRQWAYRGEAWDLFCLNPKEDPTPASESLRDEIAFSAEREKKLAGKGRKGGRRD